MTLYRAICCNMCYSKILQTDKENSMMYYFVKKHVEKYCN